MPTPTWISEEKNKFPATPAPWTLPKQALTLDLLSSFLTGAQPKRNDASKQWATLVPVLGALLAGQVLGEQSTVTPSLPSDGGLGLALNYKKDF